MNQQKQPPSPEKVQRWTAKMQAICDRWDAHILVLDDMIAQLEADIRHQPMYIDRLKKAKQLINTDVTELNMN
jgi:hypothetical protein